MSTVAKTVPHPTEALPEVYVPYIPPQYVTETFEFLKKKENINSLLRITSSPLTPKDSLEDRTEYSRRWEVYNEERRLFNRPFREQEKRAEMMMWESLKFLPQDMYDEATRECANPLPLGLRFHRLYRKQILPSLSDIEKRMLQVFKNLMYLRFPFNEARAKQPGLFWISQLGKLHRSRLTALCKTVRVFK